MNKYYAIILSSLITLTSCNSRKYNAQFSNEEVENMQLQQSEILIPIDDSIQTIDLNPFINVERFDFGNIVSSTKVIKLETTSKSIVGGIYKVIVTNSNIYIYDTYKGGSVIIFDNNGRYVKRLVSGNGPGELYRVWDMEYDYNNNELYVYQHPFLVIYDSIGNYLRDTKLPLGFYNFKITNDGYIFRCIHNDANYHMGEYHKYTLILTDKNFKVQKVAFPTIPDTKLVGYSYLFNFGNDYIVTTPFTDTIYTLSNGKLQAKYSLQYKNNLDKKYINYEKHDKLMEYIGANNIYYHLGTHLETNNYSAFFLDNRNGRTIVYMNKTNSNMLGGCGHKIDAHHLPYICYPINTYNDYFVSLVLPHDYKQYKMESSSALSKEDIEKLESFEEEDNPAIVLFKIDKL